MVVASAVQRGSMFENEPPHTSKLTCIGDFAQMHMYR